MFDTSHAALASTKVTEEAQSLEVEAQFSVPMSGGLPKVKINSRADEMQLCRSVLLSIWPAAAIILRDCTSDAYQLPVSSQSMLQ